MRVDRVCRSAMIPLRFAIFSAVYTVPIHLVDEKSSDYSRSLPRMSRMQSKLTYEICLCHGRSPVQFELETVVMHFVQVGPGHIKSQ